MNVFPKRRPSESGSTLLIVFWAILILSAAIIGWSEWLYRDLTLHAEANRGLEAKAMAHSGLAMALNPMVSKLSPQLEHEFAPGLGYRVKMVSEGGKLNVNWLAAGEDPLKLGMLKQWLYNRGVKGQERDVFVDSLLDYIDADSLPHLNGVEDQGDYHAANRPLLDVEEIAQVWGSAPLTRTPGWKDDLTVYSLGPIDLTAASPGIIRLLPGLGEPGIQRFLKVRAGPDGIDGTRDDYVFRSIEEIFFYLGVTTPEGQQALSPLVTFNDQTMHVTSEGRSQKVSRQVEVVARKGAGANAQLLTWKE